jgi:DsbC/DsbD-like thiol-disulfide interchange protein
MKFALLPSTLTRRILALAAFSLICVPGFLAALALAVVGAPQLPARVPSGRDVVASNAYVSLDPAGRGSSLQVAVVMKIRTGFHVNAREKSAEYLIATDLKTDLPAGFSAGEVVYPKGKLEKFAFSKTPLNVYQDTVILKMPLTVLASAPTGEQHIPLSLRYQACSQEICLPPVTLNVDAVVNVAASASASKPAHLEIFAGRSK